MPTKLDKTGNKLFADRLSLLGYQPRGFLSFRRTVDDCKQFIRIAGRRSGGIYMYSTILYARFDDIEAVLRPEESDGLSTTVSCPIHFLRPERWFFEWEFSNEDELRIVVDKMIDDIETFGPVFFNRFATKEGVEREFLVSEGKDFHMRGRF